MDVHNSCMLWAKSLQFDHHWPSVCDQDCQFCTRNVSWCVQTMVGELNHPQQRWVVGDDFNDFLYSGPPVEKKKEKSELWKNEVLVYERSLFMILHVCGFRLVYVLWLTLNEWSRGEQWILFPENLKVSQDEVQGNKIHCSPRDQSLSYLLYSKTKQKQILKKRAEIPATTSGHVWSRATAVNISRVTVNCFQFDVTVFAMLPAHGIWRETVSLIDVMRPGTSQWMDAL